MLDMMRKIENKEDTFENVNKSVGKKFADEYINPIVDKLEEKRKNDFLFKFQIYKNLFRDCNYSEKYNDWGPVQMLKEKYGHPTSPNHLGLLGQDVVLERFTKDLESWKHD